MNRIVRVKMILFLILAFLLLVSYQNCGQSFKPVTADKSLLQNSQQGSSFALKLNPLGPEVDPHHSNNLLQTIEQNLIAVELQGLQELPFLSNGILNFDKNTGHSGELADPSDRLDYPITDSRWLQVNSYYHMHNLFIALQKSDIGLEDLPSVTVDASCATDLGQGLPYQSNAYYSSEDQYICLGYADLEGEKAWAALDADTVVHELGHAINHAVASSAHLLSSMDAQAVDEGLSDAFAFLQHGQSSQSWWYGKAIQLASGSNFTPFYGLRNLETPLKLSDRILDRHQDGRFISSTVRSLFNEGVEKKILLQSIMRTLEGLTSGFTFGNFFLDLKDELISLDVEQSLIETVYSSTNLWRKDDVGQLILNATKPMYIIDGHEFQAYQVNGNCNDALDAGEKALLYLNLENTGSELGSVFVAISPATQQQDVKIIDGGHLGTYVGFKSSGNYLRDTLKTPSNTPYKDLLLYSVFVLEAGSQAIGAYDFNITLIGFNTIDDQPIQKTIPITVQVGSEANLVGNCPNNGEADIWPSSN